MHECQLAKITIMKIIYVIKSLAINIFKKHHKMIKCGVREKRLVKSLRTTAKIRMMY